MITTALSRVLEHARRDTCGPVWDICIAAVSQALGGAAAAAAAAAPATAAAALTHAIAFVAHLVEFFRGSRVPGFAPVLRTLRELLASPAAWPAVPQTGDAAASTAGGPPRLVLTDPEQTTEADTYDAATAPGQVLRLALAVVRSHGKAAGASGGPGVMQDLARAWEWDPLFARAPMREYEAFATEMLQPPTPPDAAAPFLPRLTAALERSIVRLAADPAALDVPLAVIGRSLRGMAGGMPAHAWSGVGGAGHRVRADAACEMVEACSAAGTHEVVVTDPMRAAMAMGALQWLSGGDAGEWTSRTLDAALGLFRVAVPAATAVAATPVAAPAAPGAARGDGMDGASAADSAGFAEGFAALPQALASVLMQGAGRAVCSVAARAAASESARAHAAKLEVHDRLLEVLENQPGNFPAVAALAELCERSDGPALGLSGAAGVDQPDSGDGGQRRAAVIAGLQRNLASASRALRTSTLRVLLHDAVAAAGTTGRSAEEAATAGAGGTAPALSDGDVRERLVRGFLECEERPVGLETGRAAVAWLRRVAAMLEYGQVPPDTVELVVLSLLGMTHLKFGDLRCAPPAVHAA